MGWLAYCIGVGWNFYAGVVLLCGALVGYIWSDESWIYRVSSRVNVLGLVLVSFATVIPYWMLGVILVAGLLPLTRKLFRRPVVIYVLLGLLLATTVFHYGTLPSYSVSLEQGEPTILLGDSLSRADLVESGVAYPVILNKDYGYTIENRSRNGAIVANYSNNDDLLDRIRGQTVIIELGGNDMLGRSDLESYRENLDELLGALSNQDNKIIMFELPVPLFKNSYGQVQHRLANKYDVALIPRSYLSEVISLKGLTVDGLHFSQEGHRLMARRLDELFSS